MPATGNARTAIEAQAAEFCAAFARGDAAAVAGLYTSDAQVLPAGVDAIAGRPGIRQFWESAMDMGIKSVDLEVFEVEQFGDVAYDVGRYTLKSSDGGALDHGKYLVIWRREGDSWKIHRDIWTTNTKQ